MRLTAKKILLLLGTLLGLYLFYFQNTSYKEIYLVGIILFTTIVYAYFAVKRKNDIFIIPVWVIWGILLCLREEFHRPSASYTVFLISFILFTISVMIDFLFFRQDFSAEDQKRIFQPQNWL